MSTLLLIAATLSLLGPVWNLTLGHFLRAPMLPWNATSAALGFSFFAGLILYRLDPSQTMSEMLDEMFMLDIAVIGLVFCKAIARCPEAEGDSFREHLRCFVTAPTICDRAVLAIFPLLMWPGYVLGISEYHRWWLLAWAGLAQFLIAGHEAVSDWLSAKRSSDEQDAPSSGLMRVAWESGVGT